MPHTKLIAKYYPYVLLTIFSWFFYLMIRLTLQYVPFSSEVAFLLIKQTEVQTVKWYLPIFFVHVYSAIFVLIAGFTQFSATILKTNKSLHRNAGKLYAIVVLVFAAPSGIFMGCFANGAWHSKVSFIVLGIIWWLFTGKAMLAIWQRQFILHEKMMVRSFALALSAITLRAWKVIIVYSFGTAPMDTYQIIAWLGWIPNLLIAEYYLNQKLK
ncbi:MAG: DUF2306 domain-containing protein [Flavobacterium sp.]|nr:DUF2306 domain-containing protein [Flavobacterium sp.]